MRIFAEVPWTGASDDSGVVDNGNFQCLRYVIGNFRDKANIIMYRYGVIRRLPADPKTRYDDSWPSTNPNGYFTILFALVGLKILFLAFENQYR